MNKKGQATLEFLVTYGWVILIVTVVAASLLYFGIFRTEQLVPERCSSSPEIECLDSQIGFQNPLLNTGTVRMRLKNNLGEAIIINDWGVYSDNAAPFVCNIAPGTATVGVEGVINAIFDDCDFSGASFNPGDREKINFNISYYLAKSSSSFSNKVEGEIVATIVDLSGSFVYPECSDGINNDPVNNNCKDYSEGDTGCSSPFDTTEAGGTCPPTGPPADSLECFVTTVCNDLTLLRLSGLSDAHAENYTQLNYGYELCCRSDIGAGSL